VNSAAVPEKRRHQVRPGGRALIETTRASES